jgi:hypothetical protein
MYDDFVASREAVEAQIAADAVKRRRYQFCDSSDEEQPISGSKGGDSGGGEMEAEVEASFSSVEAQSQVDAIKRRRYQFFHSSDEEQSSFGCNSDDGSSRKMEAEEEADFSSVVGLGVN